MIPHTNCWPSHINCCLPNINCWPQISTDDPTYQLLTITYQLLTPNINCWPQHINWWHNKTTAVSQISTVDPNILTDDTKYNSWPPTYHQWKRQDSFVSSLNHAYFHLLNRFLRITILPIIYSFRQTYRI